MFQVWPYIATLKFIIETASFICICIICGLSRKNPFEYHSIKNLDIYFNDVVNNSNTKNFLPNDSIYKNLINKHLIKMLPKNRYKKIYSEKIQKRKILLRQLVSTSFCLDIRDDFEKFKGSKLSSIFDLNYTKIKNVSIADLVCSCVVLLFMIVCRIIKRIHGEDQLYFSSKRLSVFHSRLLLIFIVLATVSYIAKLILSIILFYFIEKGDIEKYDEFLDCKNVKREKFEEFSDITKLRNNCIALLIFNVFSQGIDQIEKFIDFSIKNIEEEKEKIITKIRDGKAEEKQN